jgi:hypothetical protein
MHAPPSDSSELMTIPIPTKMHLEVKVHLALDPGVEVNL